MGGNSKHKKIPLILYQSVKKQQGRLEHNEREKQGEKRRSSSILGTSEKKVWKVARKQGKN